MKKLIWLLGPPGSGKSTYASKFPHEIPRVVEINQMLFPLTKNTNINFGVKAAINSIVRLIKSLELKTENLNEKSLLVITGLVDKDVLFPLSIHEEVWIILPPYDRWKLQLKQRPLGIKKGEYYEKYCDYQYAEKWYWQFQKDWLKNNPEIKLIDTTFDLSLVGKLHYS